MTMLITLRSRFAWPLIAGLLVAIVGLVWVEGGPSTFAQADTTAPTVSSVAITSDPDADDTDLGAYSTGRSSESSNWASGVYRIGDEVQATMTFSENVAVTGSPQLELAIGSSNRTAEYESTDGSAVVFSYTVAERDSDSNGIAIGANKLTLNSGSIKDDADNDANLSHNALTDQDDHEVDGIRPRISRFFLAASSGGSDGAYSEGEELIIVAEFSEDYPRGSVTGPPQVTLDFDGEEKGTARWDISLRFNSPYTYGTFGYVVQEGDLDSDGVAISANSIDVNGGFIRDPAGNDAILTHSAVAASSTFKVDAVAPTVSSIAITSDPGDDDTYGIGDKIEVTVTFSESMSLPTSITCSPDVVHCNAELELDVGGTARTADYQSHDGADVVYAYTVQAGDADENGIGIGANKLTGQRIRDAAGRNGEGINEADLSHDAVADDVGHKVDTVPAPPKSTDATLSALTLSGIDIDTFASGTTSYTAQVASSVTETTVAPTVNHSEASYVIKLGEVTDEDGEISLGVGSNLITVEVTAEDGQTKRTYSVTVTRPVSTDATLKRLLLSSIDIGVGMGVGAISGSDTSYSTSVYHSVSQTTVSPTPNHSFASYVIKLGGVTDSDGAISLAVGSNVITVEVTAEDDSTTETYTVTVNRATASAQTTGELSTDDPPVNFRAIYVSKTFAGFALSFPRNRGINGYVMQRYEHDDDRFVSSGSDSRYESDSDEDYGGGRLDFGDTNVEPGTLYKWVAELTNSQGSTVIEKSVTVRIPPDETTEISSDATLSALTLTGMELEKTGGFHAVVEGFASSHLSYDASVANNVSETTVAATVNHSGASYVIKLDGVEDADGVISLSVGSNIITIEVAAEDGETTRTYTVAVTRAAALSTDATLSALTLSRVDFGTFAPGTTSYIAQVANSVSQTTVTPTVNHSGADYVIKLDGVTDADGVVSLSLGSNVITIEVTAEDDSTTQTYTVAVTRAVPPSMDATLSALTLSGIDFGTFASGTTSYTASVANSVSQTTVTPTENHSGASYVIKLDGVEDADGVVSLSVGSNVITVEVTAEDDSTTQTYTVTVTRAAPPSMDATLSALTLSGIDIGTFDSTTTSFTAQVANSVSQTTVTPTVNHSGASYVIKLGGVEDADGTISLAVVSNVITVEVTAEDDETTQTYTVTVTRAAPPSMDATLKALMLSGIDIGTFDSTTSSYTAQVVNSVSQTTVTPTVNHSGANYVIKLGGVTDVDGVVALAVGTNVITVEVTVEDDSTTRTYTVTVTRAAPVNPQQLSSDAKLSVLTLSGIDFGTFDSTTTSYTARVANSVTETTVTPTVSHSGASYMIKLGGATDADGVVSLAVGTNVITIDMTAEDDSTTQTYTVTVTRSAPPSTDATLSALTLSGVDFGTFAAGTTSYTAEVANSVSKTTVAPTVNHPGASYVIKLGGETDADGVIALSVGSNVITVEVTAEDDSTAQSYTVTVTRAPEVSSERMRDLYDSDGDGIIDRGEVIDAIVDYFDGDITKDEVIEVIKLYFSDST